MGTRSLTHLHEEGLESPIFLTIYKQFDGYPSGLGEEIAECLGKRELVNGYNNEKTQVNGIGCAAALLISHLKGDDAGGVYISKTLGEHDAWHDYSYDIYVQDDELYMQITERYRNTVLGFGRIKDFDSEKLKNEDEDEE